MSDTANPSTLLRSLVVIGAIAVIALAVGSALILQFGFTVFGASLPTLVCFASMLAIQLIAQRASLAKRLAEDVARLQAELDELSPAGRALEQASEDLALAAHTLRGVDAPHLHTDAEADDLDALPAGSPSLARQLESKQFSRAATKTARNAPSGASVRPQRTVAEDRDHGAHVRADDDLARRLADELYEADESAATAAPIESPGAGMVAALASSEPARQDLRLGSVPVVEPRLAETLRRSARDGDIDILLQPIVALGDRKARMYDVFPRLKMADGGRVNPVDYWAPAHQLGLALVIERHVVMRAMQIVRKLNERGRARGLFCRLSQSALADRGLVAGLTAAARSSSDVSEHIIIELSARDYLRHNGPEREGLAELCRMGFRFGLEGVDSLAVDRHKLATDRVHFLKISPTALAAEHRVAGFAGMAGLISELRRSGIDVILDQVTDEGIAALGTDCGIILGQGPTFGEPRPLAPDFLMEVDRARVA